MFFHPELYDVKLVNEYTSMSFSEIMDIDCISFKILLRDAFIYQMNQTEEGREYLAKAYMLKQTEPDRAGLMTLSNKIGRH